MSQPKLVQIRSVGATAPAEEGVTLLDAALKSGVNYPYSCRAGRCGACKTRLISGEVKMDSHSRFALSDGEKAAGMILACRAYALSDVEIAWVGEETQADSPPVEFTGTVVAKDQLTHDIVQVRVAIPPGTEFRYSAGQYAELRFPGMPARSYSMASPPGDGYLEFHVRKMQPGRVSHFVFDQLQAGDVVTVSGPFGDAYLRESHTGPILAVAGGSGLAPIHAIVRQALRVGMKQPITLYFGVREERDLYFEESLRRLEHEHSNFRFIPVLSGAGEGSGGRCRTGLVGSALLADQPGFNGVKVYLAGPPPMIESLTVDLVARGCPGLDIHADPFYSSAQKDEDRVEVTVTTG